MKRIVTLYGEGGYDPSREDGNVVLEYEIEMDQQPLGPAGVAATLNVVLGLWPLIDAANAVGLTPEQLVAEAEAWAAAAEMS